MKHFARIVAVLFLATSLFSSAWAIESHYGAPQTGLLKGVKQGFNAWTEVINYSRDSYTIYADFSRSGHYSPDAYLGAYKSGRDDITYYYDSNYDVYPYVHFFIRRNFDGFIVANNWFFPGDKIFIYDGYGNKNEKPILKIVK